MKNTFLVMKIFALLVIFFNKSNGQKMTFSIEKINIIKSKINKNEFSTWDLHKPNIVTFVKLDNFTKDTIRFDFEPVNCFLIVSVGNKLKTIPLNYAYHRELEGLKILPDSSMSLQLMWRVSNRVLNLKKKTMVNIFVRSFLLIRQNEQKIISTKTKKVYILVQ